ncbi:hypothetical protein JX265_013972 [Neoarthrinium moseri]|uniref:GED domain-containing protein n=1 Tax=Neoarthrinium moseri TaxID=1658444 RepID=A0A9P9W7J7_9PEZI|nr:hypothetical protein JX265_013972 [Neoarthrinium moseri]
MDKNTNGLDRHPASLFDNLQIRLFDSMHRLSKLNVCGGIDVPQLIVAGSQSSGKSSVLESLVRFHFPVDDKKPTTRFPIKLVLRTAKEEHTKVTIESREGDDKHREGLRRLADELSGETFDRIMEKAKVGLRMLPSNAPNQDGVKTQIFCCDSLVIERHGPSLPALDVLDLPGLFDASTAEQTEADRDTIDKLVKDQIYSPMNIVLLIVSAQGNDYSNFPALGIVQRRLTEDPLLKRRVVCVITRPDKASSLEATRSVLGKENQFIKSFQYPWHVVRNQDQASRENHQSLDERDLLEDKFFASPDWTTVPPRQKGIAALRETLKSMIWSHTRYQLPSVISKTKRKICEAEAQLNSIIRARSDPQARRAYLGDVAETFSILTREAVKGTYENERCDKDHETGDICHNCQGFFAGFGTNNVQSQQKRLRANVRALNQAFASAMRQYGRTKVESESDQDTRWTDPSLDLVSERLADGGRLFQPEGTAMYYEHEKPKPQDRKEYEHWVRTNMDRWKSKGPGGEPSDGAFSGLFSYQSEKWEKIASQHVKAVWKVVNEFIQLALAASCPDEDVLAKVRSRLVDPSLRVIQLQADRTLRDLISCHSQSNPGFYDSFIEARTVREYTEAVVQRLSAMKLHPEDSSEATSVSTTPSTEPPNGQAIKGPPTSNQRQGDMKAKVQQNNAQRSGETKAKGHDQKAREAMLNYALENVTNVLGLNYPILRNGLLREIVFPMISQRISMIYEPKNYRDGNINANSVENIQKSTQDLYPRNFGDFAAARVIEQVEMHYEEIQASFVGYVSSLVVERNIMEQLPKKILNMTIIRDLEEHVVEDIARERPEDAKKRQDIERDLNTMQDVLKEMEDYLHANRHSTP